MTFLPPRIPGVDSEAHLTRQAHAAFFRMLLSYLSPKLTNHLEFFSGSLNLPKTGPVIIVANHQSYFDGFAITSLFWKLTGRKVRIPTNIKALTNPLTTFFQVAGGAVPINPADSADTYARIKALLEKGEVVVIYPEGTRSDGTYLHPFKFGAFNLAVEHDVPILPIAVRNFASILPKGSLRFKAGETGSITFGPLIYPSDPQFAGQNPKAVAGQMSAQVRRWMEQTVFTTPRGQDLEDVRDAEVAGLAARADMQLEEFLDKNVELITRKDARDILNIVSAKKILGRSSFELDLQELRAVGFELADLPPYRAVFSLRRYKSLLKAALKQRPDHAYLNYCVGLLHFKLPSLRKSRQRKETRALFRTAYDQAERDGYPKERFVHGYATALARDGAKQDAISLLRKTFDGPQNTTSVRELRRRERGISLMRKLQNEDDTAPVSEYPTRDLRGFELVMSQTRISDIIVAQVDGISSKAQVVAAAQALQARHPGLRARVVWPQGRDKRPVFEYLPADPSRAFVQELTPTKRQRADKRAFWERVAEQEVNHLFDLSEGYMFRVTWLPETGHIILNAQHSVVDGVSLMRLLHEFASHCAGQGIGPELAPTPSALESGPSINIIEKIAGWFHRETFIRARRSFQDWASLPLSGRLEKGEQLKTECYFDEGDTANFEAITQACRRHGVTVGGAYAAAIQCAMLHFSNSGLSTKEKYYLPMDVSLRRYMEGSENDQESVGLFSGTASPIFNGDPTSTFWDVARSFMEKSKDEIDMKSPLIFHQVFDRFFNLEKAYQRYSLDCVEAGGAGGPLTMSNVGKFPFDTQTGDVRINTLHGMSASQKGGAMLYFWLRTVNGKFFYNSTAINPAASREFGQSFFSFVVYLMENCVSPSAEREPLSDYIPEAAAKHSYAATKVVVSAPQPELVA